MGLCHSRESDTEESTVEGLAVSCEKPWDSQAVTSSERSAQITVEHERPSIGSKSQPSQLPEDSFAQLEFPVRGASSGNARPKDEYSEAEAVITSQRETTSGLEAFIEKQNQVIECHEDTISSLKKAIQEYKLLVSALERTREDNEKALEDQKATLESHAQVTRTHSSTIKSLQVANESYQQIIKSHELTVQRQKKAIDNHETEMNVLQRAIDERARSKNERDNQPSEDEGPSKAHNTAMKAKQEAIAALEGERDELRHAGKTKDAVITDLRSIIAAQQKAKAPVYAANISAGRTEELQKKITSLERANDVLYEQISSLKLAAAGVSKQASARNDLGAGRFERDRMAAVLTTMQGGVRWDGWEGRGFAFDPMERR